MSDDSVGGLGERGNGEALPHGGLVPSGGDRGGRIVAQPETLGRRGRDHHPLVVDGQDGVERCPIMEGHDGVHRGVASSQRHDHGPVAHRAGQGLTMLGPDHDVDTQASGRGHEVRCPVAWQSAAAGGSGAPPYAGATNHAEARAP